MDGRLGCTSQPDGVTDPRRPDRTPTPTPQTTARGWRRKPRAARLSSVDTPLDTPLNTTLAEGLARGHVLQMVVLFGSRATGRARPGSDTDVAVLHASDKPLDLRSLGALTGELEELTGTPVDVVDLATADALLRMEIIRHGRVLHHRHRDDWVHLKYRTMVDCDDIAWALPMLIEGVERRARAAAER